MAKIRCKLSYHELTGDPLNTFAVGVDNGIYSHNPPFITPPVTQAAYQALITAFVNEHAAYEGHTATKAEMEEKRLDLMTGLDTQSNYVNTVANGDAAVIELAGFLATKGSGNKKNKPGQPTGVELNRGISRELVSNCPVVENAEAYGAILVAGNPLPPGIVITDGGQIIYDGNSSPMPGPMPGPTPGSIVFIMDLTKGRKKKFSNLQIGTTYYIYYWAANSAGVSVLSEGVSRSVIE